MRNCPRGAVGPRRSSWRLAFAAVLLMLVPGPAVVRAAIGLDQWTYKLVSNQHFATLSLGFGDVDRDGRPDIVSGRYWYRNPAGGLTGTWTQENFPSDLRVFAVADVDGDALTDVFAQTTFGSLDVYWLEATDAAATAWIQVYVGSVPQASHPEGAQGYRIGQIEAGGRPEVAITSGDGIYYFRIPASPQAGSWPRVHVSSAPSDEGFALGDIDRDGRLDITGTTGDLKGVWWYRNPGDGTDNWVGHQIATFSEADFPDRTEVADFNGDGRLDVVVTEENALASEASTVWWEQPTDVLGGTWAKHPLTSQGSTNSLDVADIDQDGDTDVIIAEHKGALKLAIWSNDGSGAFTEHVVSTGKESHLGARTVDLDGDGDLDIVSIAWDAYQNVHLWRNDNGGASGVTVGDAVPGAARLGAFTAWPNPFNPAVTIRAELRLASPVRVGIYDAAGRLVRQLYDRIAAAGLLELRWDGTDDRGVRAASGIYLVRAEAGPETVGCKILMLQ